MQFINITRQVFFFSIVPLERSQTTNIEYFFMHVIITDMKKCLGDEIQLIQSLGVEMANSGRGVRGHGGGNLRRKRRKWEELKGVKTSAQINVWCR